MMPMSDLFQMDVNAVPARGVYPTMRGGTSANAAGAQTMTTNTVTTDPATGASAPTVGALPAGSKHTAAWWVGILVLLMVTVWISHKVGGPEDFKNIRPTAYNFLLVTLTAILGIVGLKVIFTKYPVPGISQVVLAA